MKEKRLTTLKQVLSSSLNPELHQHIPRAFDIIGDIAILDIPAPLLKHEKQIGEALLKLHKNIKVIAKKQGIHEGLFRTQQLGIIAGEQRKVTLYKENGISLRLDVEKVYFSPRLSTERERIAAQVKSGEHILALFSGCGPYPLVILKKEPKVHITSIELNPVAIKFQEENLILNKSIARSMPEYKKGMSSQDLLHLMQERIHIIQGDVREAVKPLNEAFDRILMPLPRGAESYLDTALSKAKPGTIIHFYDFLNEKEFPEAERKIEAACKEAKKSFKILRQVKCGQFSPGTFRICVDFKILS